MRSGGSQAGVEKIIGRGKVLYAAAPQAPRAAAATSIIASEIVGFRLNSSAIRTSPSEKFPSLDHRLHFAVCLVAGPEPGVESLDNDSHFAAHSGLGRSPSSR